MAIIEDIVKNKLEKFSWKSYSKLLSKLEKIRLKWLTFFQGMYALVSSSDSYESSLYPNFVGSYSMISKDDNLDMLNGWISTLEKTLNEVLCENYENRVKLFKNTELGILLDYNVESEVPENPENPDKISLFIGIPKYIVNDYLSPKAKRYYTFIKKGCGGDCIGCSFPFTSFPTEEDNEITEDMVYNEAAGDIKLCCGNLGSDDPWYVDYYWFNMEGLDDLICKQEELSSFIDLSDDNLTFDYPSDITSSGPGIPGLILPGGTSEFDEIVQMIFKNEFNLNAKMIAPLLALYEFDPNIAPSLDILRTRFCDANSTCSKDSIIYLSKKEIEDDYGRRDIYMRKAAFSKLGTEFLLTVTPKLDEWKWAYNIMNIISKQSFGVEAKNANCDEACTTIEASCSIKESTERYQYSECSKPGINTTMCASFGDEGCTDKNKCTAIVTEFLYSESSTSCDNPSGFIGSRDISLCLDSYLPPSTPDSPEPQNVALLTCKCSPSSWRTCQKQNSEEWPCSPTHAKNLSYSGGCSTRTLLTPITVSADACVQPKKQFKTTQCTDKTKNSTYGPSSEDQTSFLIFFYNLFDAIINIDDMNSARRLFDLMCINSAIRLMNIFIEQSENIATPNVILTDKPIKAVTPNCLTENGNDSIMDTTPYIIKYKDWYNVTNECNCGGMYNGPEGTIPSEEITNAIDTCENIAQNFQCDSGEFLKIPLRGLSLTFVSKKPKE